MSGNKDTPKHRGGNSIVKVIERVEALPGVRSASLAYTVVLSVKAGARACAQRINRRMHNRCQWITTLSRQLTLPTLGLGLVAGRDFAATDQAQAPGVVILNETLARRLFPGDNPVGQQLIRYAGGVPQFSLEVVGVVKMPSIRLCPSNHVRRCTCPRFSNIAL